MRVWSLFVFAAFSWHYCPAAHIFPTVRDNENVDGPFEEIDLDDEGGEVIYPDNEGISMYEIMSFVPGEEVDDYLKHPMSSPIQSHDYSTGSLTSLEKYWQFEGVSADSLNRALHATVALCMRYKDHDTDKIRTYRSNGYYFNSTHILTNRHNLFACILVLGGGGTIVPCDAFSKSMIEKISNHYNAQIYHLERVLALDIYNYKICHSKKDERYFENYEVEMDGITRFNEDFKKQKNNLHYWMKLAHMQDFAMLKGPLTAKEHVYINIDPNLDFSSIIKDKDASKLRFVLVGFSPRFDSRKEYHVTNYIHDNNDVEFKFLSGDAMNDFFKYSQFPAFSIGNGFKIDMVEHLLIHHQIPTYGGFSGSCVYYVNEADNGNLVPIASHIGAVGQGQETWNDALSFAHPFVKKHLSHSQNTKKKVEL